MRGLERGRKGKRPERVKEGKGKGKREGGGDEREERKRRKGREREREGGEWKREKALCALFPIRALISL